MEGFLNKFLNLVIPLLGILVIGIPASNAAEKTVTIGYQKVYNPWKVAIVDGAFEKATGYKITWKQFTTGAKVLKAMDAGKVQIAMAGSSPIAAGASNSLDIELFWIVEDIGGAEALVVRNGSGIVEPQDLRRKRIGIPFLSTSHFHILFALEQFGLDPMDMRIFNLQPNSIALAWKKRTIDAAFVWEPVLSILKKTGKILITSGQLSRWGKATFDGMIVMKKWAKKNPAFMVNFVKTIAAADAAYRDNIKAWKANSAPVKKIIKLTGGNPKDVPRTLWLYRFPPLEEQASRRWLGGGSKGGAARALFYTGKFLLEQNKILDLLPDYSVMVNDRWVKMALGK